MTPLILGGCGRRAGAPPKASVVLITIDTLRADALGCYGHSAARTPSIDGLARRGVLFENAVCQAPATGPSIASMMTSTYPLENGVVHSTLVLGEKNVTLAETLKKHGYRTGAFVSCSILDSKYGFAQGFDVFDDAFTKKYSDTELERDADATTQAAISWLGGQRGQRFFAWVHYFDCHLPYEKHSSEDLDETVGTRAFVEALEAERSQEKIEQALPMIRKLYDDEVSFVDGHICPCQGPVKPACDHAASLYAVVRVSGKNRHSMQIPQRPPCQFRPPTRKRRPKAPRSGCR